MKIYKYPIRIIDAQAIEMPKGARLLSVQTQRDEPQLWAMVDPSAPLVQREFALRGTGHDATGLSMATFVGTFQMHGGSLVFHLFDVGEAAAE